jgi:hypothetical protein
MNMAKAKVFGTAILSLVIILTGCNPEVSNIQMRRGHNAQPVGNDGPPVTNQTLSAPTGVSTTVLSTGKIRVSWNEVPGAESYRVYYGEANNNIIKYYVIVKAPATSWEDNDALDNGETYYYQVQAVNASGEGPLSSVTQQAYNPFIGTWRNVSDSSDTFVFTDRSVTHSYVYSGSSYSASGSYTYSKSRATLTLSYVDHTGVYTADITGSNSLRMSYGNGYSDNFTRR